MDKHIKAGKGSIRGKPVQLGLRRQTSKFIGIKGLRVREGSVGVIITNELRDGGQLNKTEFLSI